MANALFTPLADAIVTLLNAQTFATAFTATRIYDPLRPLEENETLRIDVVLGDRKSDPLDRSRLTEDVRVEVAARQVISAAAGSAAETTALDALVALVEEINTFLCAPAQRRPVAWAGWQRSELVYPYLPAHLREKRQFTSLLRMSYLVVTDSLWA